MNIPIMSTEKIVLRGESDPVFARNILGYSPHGEFKYELLDFASGRGLEDIVHDLIKMGINVRGLYNLDKAINQATIGNHLGIVMMLAAAGAKLEYATVQAAGYGYLDILKFLLDENRRQGTYDTNLLTHALEAAVHNNHGEIIDYLIFDQGADISAGEYRVLREALLTKNIPLLNYLINIAKQKKIYQRDLISLAVSPEAQIQYAKSRSGRDVEITPVEYHLEDEVRKQPQHESEQKLEQELLKRISLLYNKESIIRHLFEHDPEALEEIIDRIFDENRQNLIKKIYARLME